MVCSRQQYRDQTPLSGQPLERRNTHLDRPAIAPVFWHVLANALTHHLCQSRKGSLWRFVRRTRRGGGSIQFERFTKLATGDACPKKVTTSDPQRQHHRPAYCKAFPTPPTPPVRIAHRDSPWNIPSSAACWSGCRASSSARRRW